MGELTGASKQSIAQEVHLDVSHRPPGTRARLKNYLVTRGIRALCGKSTSLSPAVATEIPLGRAAVRYMWLRALEAAGCKTIRARSGFGHPFLCHLGDLSEFPYYHPMAQRRELSVCAAWLNLMQHPIVYDVGANTGFFVTQLAQMTAGTSAHFYAFEAVPRTFSMLQDSIHRLGLERMIEPVAAAVLDGPGKVGMKCCDRNSLLGRLAVEGEPLGSSDNAVVEAITLDAFCAATGTAPSFLKIDVEGAEPAVMRGAKDLLMRHRPAIAFEYNPDGGCGEIAALRRGGPLDGYRFHYIDDLAGQLRPLGSAVDNLQNIDWICNLFAVPEECRERWSATIDTVRRLI